jgi:hypothetical protein
VSLQPVGYVHTAVDGATVLGEMPPRDEATGLVGPQTSVSAEYVVAAGRRNP